MKQLMGLSVLLVLVGCQSTPVKYPTVGDPTDDPNCPSYANVSSGFYGGDGSSEAEAVEMVGVKYTSQRWFSEKYPGAKIVMRALITSPKSKRNYDVITFETSGGEEKEAWFWVSGGFGCLFKATR